MRVAVTGAWGFIGRRVVASLLRLGAEVITLTRPGSSHDAFSGFGGTSGYPVIENREINLSHPIGSVNEACGDPDVLLHLAWSGVQDVHSLRHITHELPLHASFLGAALRSGIPHVLAVGSCFEYGMTEGLLTEEIAVRPTTAYADAKVRLHDYIRNLAESTASSLTWLRPFYVYGPGQPNTTVWGQLQAAIARGDTIFPMSPGQQTRDYLPVEEMGRLIAEVAVRPPGPSPVLNVCSGTSSRMLDIVRNWISASGSDIREAPGALPYAPSEPMNAVGSRESLNQLLRSPR